MTGNYSRAFVCVLIAGSVLLCAPAFAQLSDTNTYLAPNYTSMQPPAAGQTFVDPVFGTTILRVSDALHQTNADKGGNLVFITDEYSTMSAFNNDNSRFLAIFQSYFALYDGSGRFIKNLPFEINCSSEPRWSRKAANILYYIRGNQLKQYNSDTDAIAVVQTFTQYTSLSGKGESDICFDGDHFVLVGNSRYIFVYEISTGRTGTVLDTGGRLFDSVYITPNDNVTVTWLAAGGSRYNGIEMFDRNMNFQRQLSTVGGHMDVTRDTNGDEVLILTNSADPAPKCDNALVKIRLADGQQTCLVSLDWNLAVHVSAPDNNGWCFVDTYAPSDPIATPGWTRYTNELLQVKLDGSQVRRLAHHRSRPFNSYNYQPHVSVSRDGTRILYNSNFGLQSTLGYPTEYSDLYMMTVPQSASSGSTGTTTAVTSGTTTVFEEQNTAISYSGSWFNNSNAGHSGGAARLAMDAGSRANLTFTGSSVRWIGYQDEWSGIARVYIDGSLAATVDTYASPAKFRSVLFSQTGLAAGAHAIVIEATGSRSSASGGSWIWLDSLVVESTATSTSTGSTGSTTTTPTSAVVEEKDAAVSYSGSWFNNSNAGHSDGGARLAMDKGSRASLTFTGTSVTWTGYRDEWSGIARVYIDGTLAATVDTYETPARFKAVLFTRNNLTSGTHKITIEATGRRRSASKGSWIWIDTFGFAQK